MNQPEYSNLLKDRFPSVFSELHLENNTHLNLDTLTYGSAKRGNFKCPINNDHPIYSSSIHNRTNVTRPSNCPACYKDNQRKCLQIINENQCKFVDEQKILCLRPIDHQIENNIYFCSSHYELSALDSLKCKHKENFVFIGRKRRRIGTSRMHSLCKFVFQNHTCEKMATVEGYCQNHIGGKLQTKIKSYIMGRDLHNTSIFNNQEYRNKQRKVDEIGYKSEMYVLQTILPNFSDLISNYKLTNSGDHAADIIYQLNDEIPSSIFRTIQVKTLHKQREWRLKTENYESNTLIIAVDKSRSFFVLIWSQEQSRDGMHFCFNSKKRTKNEKYMYNFNNSNNSDVIGKKTHQNKVDFYFDMLLMLNESRVHKEDLTKNQIKEIEMVKRLELTLSRYEMKVSYPTGGYRLVYDIIITNQNGKEFRVQLKCSKKKNGKQYHFSCQKTMRRIPYETNDPIDVFIFEIDDFKNYFYIISKEEMETRGFIRSPSKAGRVTISIPPPLGYKLRKNATNQWILNTVNNYDIFKG